MSLADDDFKKTILTLNITHFTNKTSTETQWCKFMSKNLKFPLESRADGEGKLAWRRNIKSASFHARSDSEIYTTEYNVLIIH